MKIFTHYIQTNNKIGKKAFVISDLHIYREKDLEVLAKILEYIEKNNFDFIYIVGDIIDATNILHSPITNSWLEKFYAFFGILGSLAPTFIVYGNHDFGYFPKNKKWIDDKSILYANFLNKISGYKGIHIIENKTYELGDGYTISGYNPNNINGYKFEKEDKEKQLEDLSFLTKLNASNFNTLLCHYPSLCLDLANEQVLKNVNLSIAGHNHNGITQLRVFPLESLLNLFNQKNRGLITAEKSMMLKDTKYLRGTIKLNDKNTLIINPALKTFSACTGILQNLNPFFYQGASVIYYLPKENDLKRIRK